MALTIKNSALSDLTNVVEDVTIDSMNVDSPTGQDETEYQNSKWAQQWGYFNQVADLKSAILLKAIWIIGAGYDCDPKTKVILDHIKGWGKDTFRDVLFNVLINKFIGGDGFAEIIRADDKDKTILNIKNLNPGSIKIVVDKYGMLKKYIQTTSLPNGQKHEIEFQPDEILHLCNNRLADQIHGISDIDALEKKILADNESFVDTKWIMHRQARPLIMFKLGTDDQAVISAFIAKMDSATNKGENIYIPDDKNAVSYEVVQVNPSSMVLQWRDSNRADIFRGIGLPEILPGSGAGSEADQKVKFLAFEHINNNNQDELEQQLLKQLNLKINLNSPPTLEANLQTDANKDGNNAFKPSDVQAGVGA